MYFTVYIYLIIYWCGSSYDKKAGPFFYSADRRINISAHGIAGEFTGSFFYYADKKISDCELEDLEKTIREITYRAEHEARERFMTNVLGIKKHIKLCDGDRREIEQDFLANIVAIKDIKLIE